MSDDDVRDTLIDCITSFVSHGGMAVAAADYILSDASGLSVYATDALAAAEQRADTLAEMVGRIERRVLQAQAWPSTESTLVGDLLDILSSRPVQPEGKQR